ncbi:hypothetical protein F5884DRAFT_23934 [Xylogone sp. PMI_703]|nr:hypothetical protein F5884DRAFT_23934 [Xylogone sp. PMI_703]
MYHYSSFATCAAAPPNLPDTSPIPCSFPLSLAHLAPTASPCGRGTPFFWSCTGPRPELRCFALDDQLSCEATNRVIHQLPNPTTTLPRPTRYPSPIHSKKHQPSSCFLLPISLIYLQPAIPKFSFQICLSTFSDSAIIDDAAPRSALSLDVAAFCSPRRPFRSSSSVFLLHLLLHITLISNHNLFFFFFGSDSFSPATFAHLQPRAPL